MNCELLWTAIATCGFLVTPALVRRLVCGVRPDSSSGGREG
ncbi:hypothetical protein WQQ_17950 [Hydrocarboniphaga effusa AP103]|uniref:Uncharacterized protein n=1 Tax=Hydrocarboniphaga effusa AP103 TaxID=1172194 RepID=I8TD82_9GAMM|nr:hypothetical protein WQQ_17950 [Hydrocarboniphaga effusa AP103]